MHKKTQTGQLKLKPLKKKINFVYNGGNMIATTEEIENG